MSRTATAEPEQKAGSKWRQHTEEYLNGFEDTAQDIHQTARNMPHDSFDDAERIVEMAVTKVRKHADEYREKKRKEAE